MNTRDVQGKIDFLMDNFEKLERLKRYSFEEISANFERADSILYRLQTSIEALLDIGRYVISQLGLRIPGTNAEVIEILTEHGLLPEHDAVRYIQMVGFRNRVVHEYNTVDLKKLYSILQEESDDLKEMCALLLQVIERHKSGENPGDGSRFLR